MVVLDVVSPGGGGPAALEALRDHEVDARVIWTSGRPPDGADLPEPDAPFLQKPFSGADLNAMVRSVLETR